MISLEAGCNDDTTPPSKPLQLTELVAGLTTVTGGLVATSSLPHDDLERLAVAAARLGFEYTAIGTVVNLAARLCGEAQGGEVLAAERVITPLAESVTTQSTGSIELKGMTRPVATHRVVELRTHELFKQ